ncbi:MAG TPA: hypothetical protein VGZ22_26450 [Isosphaeraceae bacterium]|jgi:hypothetical protein|nr:hypothetical protein [Isosphaeraceae bacterium]
MQDFRGKLSDGDRIISEQIEGRFSYTHQPRAWSGYFFLPNDLIGAIFGPALNVGPYRLDMEDSASINIIIDTFQIQSRWDVALVQFTSTGGPLN